MLKLLSLLKSCDFSAATAEKLRYWFSGIKIFYQLHDFARYYHFICRRYFKFLCSFISVNIVYSSLLKITVKLLYTSFIDSSVLLSKVLHFKNKSSFGYCWHKVCFIFICKQKYNIWYFVFCMRIVCILKRWQAYLQKWFLNACGYFWFITWWHVKKSSKKTFSSFVCSKKSKILYTTIRANVSP